MMSGINIVLKTMICCLILLNFVLQLNLYQYRYGFRTYSKETKKKIKEVKFMTHEVIRRDFRFEPSTGTYDNLGAVGDGGVGICNGRFVSKPFRNSGVFDFYSKVKTNLNIVFIGSSIGHQFFRGFEKSSNIVKNEIIRYAWGHYHTNTEISLTPDGGRIGVLRVTGMFSKKNRNKSRKMAPSGGGGWLDHDIRELRRMANEWRTYESIDGAHGGPTSPCEAKTKTNSTHFFNHTINAFSEYFYSCEEKNFDIAVVQVAVSRFYQIIRKQRFIYRYPVSHK